MRTFSIFIAAFMLYCRAGNAQSDDDIFYKNFGMNIGYTAAMPQYPALHAFKEHYNAETGFIHTPMSLDINVGKGFCGGFSLFGFKDYMDFEYRVLAVKGTYELPKNSIAETYGMKFYQHSVRYSYNRGIAFGKFGQVGIYAGAAVFAGTFGIKTKYPGKKNFDGLSVDNFHSFTIGISPQLTLRLKFLELKAFYDYPFLSHNLSPVYNKMFENAQVPDASSDTRLKGKFINPGISATFFIPFGKPKPRPEPREETEADRKQLQKFREDQKQFENNRKKETEESRKRIEDMQRQQEKQEKRWNEKWNR